MTGTHLELTHRFNTTFSLIHRASHRKNTASRLESSLIPNSEATSKRTTDKVRNGSKSLIDKYDAHHQKRSSTRFSFHCRQFSFFLRRVRRRALFFKLLIA